MLYDAKRWDKPAVKPLEEWRRTLLQAADIIAHRGHAKHSLEVGDAVCLNGAIAASLGKGDPTQMVFQNGQTWVNTGLPLYDRVSAVVGKCAVAWNNERKRTAKQVIAALRKAAAVNQ